MKLQGEVTSTLDAHLVTKTFAQGVTPDSRVQSTDNRRQNDVKNKDDAKTAVAPPAPSLPDGQDARRRFLQHVTRALKTKTGCTAADANRSAKQVFRVVVAFAAEDLARWDWLAQQFDFLPRGRDLGWYVCAITDLVADARCPAKEAAVRGRGYSSTDEPAPASVIAQMALASMMGAER